MNSNGWYDAGRKIGDLVEDAVNSNDFSRLNKNIGDVLDDTMGMSSTRAQYRGEGNEYERAKKRAHIRKDGRGIRSTMSRLVGYSLAGVSGLIFIVMLLLAGVSGWGGFSTLAVLFLIFSAIFLHAGRNGTKDQKRSARLKQYMDIVGGRDYISIRELADATGNTEDFVRKDLKEMIREGMFSSPVYMDRNATTLMLTREAYLQYLSAERNYEASRASGEAGKSADGRKRSAGRNRAAAGGSGESAAASADGASAGTKSGNEKQLSEETQNILREGREFIAHVHEVNDQVTEEDFSRKLDKLEKVVTRIFDLVEEDPDSAPDMHRMMNYYLPITRKLIDAYVKIGNDVVPGGSGEKTRKEISASLDTVNTAFETLLDSFFEDTEWDVSSDIATMKTMMARDGLTGGHDFAPGSHIKTVAKDVTRPAADNTGTDSSQTTEKASAEKAEASQEDETAKAQGTGSVSAVSAGGGAAAAYPEEKREGE